MATGISSETPRITTTRCLAGLPQTRELVGLKVPYGAWEPDTLITDTFGNPMFSILDVQHHAMGAYEAIFGDENGHKLCYVKRRLITAYWKDGWDFCTYKPNFPGQPKYKERDMYGKSVYPFSFLHIQPLKCRYQYSVHREDLSGMETHLQAMHGWLGSMTVCFTPMVRFGKWQLDFHRPGSSDPEILIDQAKNLLEVERGNDLLAALCIAYAFDKALCQPLVTIVGYQEKEHMDDDEDSLDSFDPNTGVGGGGGGGIPPKSRGFDDDLSQPATRASQGYDDEYTEGDGYTASEYGYGDGYTYAQDDEYTGYDNDTYGDNYGANQGYTDDEYTGYDETTYTNENEYRGYDGQSAYGTEYDYSQGYGGGDEQTYGESSKLGNVNARGGGDAFGYGQGGQDDDGTYNNNSNLNRRSAAADPSVGYETNYDYGEEYPDENEYQGYGDENEYQGYGDENEYQGYGDENEYQGYGDENEYQGYGDENEYQGYDDEYQGYGDENENQGYDDNDTYGQGYGNPDKPTRRLGS